jgi:hypothetical protein
VCGDAKLPCDVVVVVGAAAAVPLGVISVMFIDAVFCLLYLS